MSNRIGAAASFAYLAALGAASVWFADAAWKSVTGYQTPYAYDAVFPAGQPLTERLALIVLDGLRVDRAAELEHLQQLAARGSSGSLRVGMPSLSNPARATMVTGAWPEVSGVTNNASFHPPPVQSLFSLARGRGLRIAAFGSSFWQRAFGDVLGGDYEHFEKELHGGHSPQELIAWQQDICARALVFLAENPANFTVVGLTAGDEAGHDFGGDSDGYRAVMTSVDACLGQIVSHFDLTEATVVAVSDHGHIDRRGQGGHGGAEPEVINAPLVMAGAGIRVNGRADGLLADLAPTVSALLGLPMPANSQGGVLAEALDAPPERLQAILRRGREQKECLTARLPDREAGLRAERRARGPAATLAALWFLALLAASLAGAAQPWRLAAAAALYFGVYYALFFALGLGYSLSAIVREEYLNGFFLKNILAAAAGYAAAVFLLSRDSAGEKHFYLRPALAITSLSGLFVAWTHAQSGLLMRGFMPDLGASFKAYMDLLAIVGVAAAAFVAFFVCRRGRRSGAA